MPTAEVTRVETKAENAVALSVQDDNYKIAGPIPFRYMAAPLAMSNTTTRGSLMRTFSVHPNQSILLTQQLPHSRFWEITDFTVTLTPVANKLNTSGRISVYYVANPYTADTLTTEHELQRALTAERRWEVDPQTELKISLNFAGQLKNCSITPELFFNRLGSLRVVCLTPPQSDACPTWQVIIEGKANFYGIDSFENKLFRTEPIFNLSTRPQYPPTIVDETSGINERDVQSIRGSNLRKLIKVPVVFQAQSNRIFQEKNQVDLQLSKRMEITYTPTLASYHREASQGQERILSTSESRLYSLVTQRVRFTSARLYIDKILGWIPSGAGPDDLMTPDIKFSEIQNRLPLVPLYEGYLLVYFDSPDPVSVDVKLPTQEGQIIVSGPWIA